jgi:hypothetical protein
MASATPKERKEENVASLLARARRPQTAFIQRRQERASALVVLWAESRGDCYLTCSRRRPRVNVIVEVQERSLECLAESAPWRPHLHDASGTRHRKEVIVRRRRRDLGPGGARGEADHQHHERQKHYYPVHLSLLLSAVGVDSATVTGVPQPG